MFRKRPQSFLQERGKHGNGLFGLAALHGCAPGPKARISYNHGQKNDDSYDLYMIKLSTSSCELHMIIWIETLSTARTYLAEDNFTVCLESTFLYFSHFLIIVWIFVDK